MKITISLLRTARWVYCGVGGVSVGGTFVGEEGEETRDEYTHADTRVDCV